MTESMNYCCFCNKKFSDEEGFFDHEFFRTLEDEYFNDGYEYERVGVCHVCAEKFLEKKTKGLA